MKKIIESILFIVAVLFIFPLFLIAGIVGRTIYFLAKMINILILEPWRGTIDCVEKILDY